MFTENIVIGLTAIDKRRYKEHLDFLNIGGHSSEIFRELIGVGVKLFFFVLWVSSIYPQSIQNFARIMDT